MLERKTGYKIILMEKNENKFQYFPKTDWMRNKIFIMKSLQLSKIYVRGLVRK